MLEVLHPPVARRGVGVAGINHPRPVRHTLDRHGDLVRLLRVIFQLDIRKLLPDYLLGLFLFNALGNRSNTEVRHERAGKPCRAAIGIDYHAQRRVHDGDIAIALLKSIIGISVVVPAAGDAEELRPRAEADKPGHRLQGSHGLFVVLHLVLAEPALKKSDIALVAVDEARFSPVHGLNILLRKLRIFIAGTAASDDFSGIGYALSQQKFVGVEPVCIVSSAAAGHGQHNCRGEDHADRSPHAKSLPCRFGMHIISWPSCCKQDGICSPGSIRALAGLDAQWYNNIIDRWGRAVRRAANKSISHGGIYHDKNRHFFRFPRRGQDHAHPQAHQ